MMEIVANYIDDSQNPRNVVGAAKLGEISEYNNSILRTYRNFSVELSLKIVTIAELVTSC